MLYKIIIIWLKVRKKNIILEKDVFLKKILGIYCNFNLVIIDI